MFSDPTDDIMGAFRRALALLACLRHGDQEEAVRILMEDSPYDIAMALANICWLMIVWMGSETEQTSDEVFQKLALIQAQVETETTDD